MTEAGKRGEKVNQPKSKEPSESPDIEAFEWLQYEDRGGKRGKLASAMLENPFVPIGMAATVIALSMGLYNMRKKNSVKQQFYMRARVGAQGFTIASLLGGVFYQSHKRDVENLEKLENFKKSKENIGKPKENKESNL